MRWGRAIGALCAAFVLVGCGNSRTADLDFIGQTIGRIVQRPAPPPTAVQIRAAATPQVLAPYAEALLAQLPDRGVASVLVPHGRNGAYQSWVTPDGIGVTLKSGMLTGTRGLGFDLMTSDVDDAYAAITGQGGGTAVRVHRYLDGEDQLFARSFHCIYSGVSEGWVTENCRNPDLQFENKYLLGQGGTIVASQQWVGPAHGILILERLK